MSSSVAPVVLIGDVVPPAAPGVATTELTSA